MSPYLLLFVIDIIYQFKILDATYKNIITYQITVECYKKVYYKSNMTNSPYSLENIYGFDNICLMLSKCENANDLNSLCKQTNISKSRFKNFCKKYNIDFSRFDGKTTILPPDKQVLIKLLQNGGKQLIVDHFNVTFTTVNRWLKLYNIKIPNYKGLVKQIPSDFEEYWKSEQPLLVDVYKKYNITRRVLLKWLDQLGIDSNSYNGPTSKLPIPSKQQLAYLNDQKIGTAGIAEHFGICQTLARKWLYHYNIDIKYDKIGKSESEEDLLQYLNSLGVGVFKSQKSILNNTKYEIDCYNDQLKVGFEYNGLYWHSSEVNQKNIKKHRDKFFQSKQQGIKLYTIFENEWLTKNNIVKSMIQSRVGLNDKIYARNTIIKQLNKQQSKQFFDDNHISGYLRDDVTYGLMYHDQIICAMSFIKPRFNKKYQWEILRFASKCNFTVVGGGSKLFRHFIKEHNPNDVLTYSDLRWGEGGVYLNMGFQFIEYTKPNYFYFKQSNQHLLYSRIKFQKHKLHKLLDKFDPGLSEIENMRNNNYFSIYDCGNAKYHWKKEGI